MERRPPSLIERHCEKLLLGVTAALALWLAWAYVFRSPNVIRYDGRALTASDLNRAILQEAQTLDQTMRLVDTSPSRIPEFHQRLRQMHEGGILDIRDDSASVTLPPRLPLAATFGRRLETFGWEHARVRLALPLPPTPPTVSSGRALVTADAQQRENERPDPREIAWVQVVARFDRGQQRQALLAAGYPSYASGVYLAGVEVQRQELLAEGESGPWEDVPRVEGVGPQLPAPVFDDGSGKLLNAGVLAAALANLKASQTLLAQPPLGRVVAGDSPAAVSKESDRAAEGAGEDSLVLCTYDRDAEPGQHYRYRVRVRLWNRLVGQADALQDAADARLTAIAGAWSPPSEPVQVTPRTHFFLLGPSPDGTAANIEAWKWHDGRWLRKPFTARVGDVIGGAATVKTGAVDESGRPIRERIDFCTGVVILDMRSDTRALRVADGKTGCFEWRCQPTLVIVCLDPADGRVTERLHLVDRADPLRDRLSQP